MPSSDLSRHKADTWCTDIMWGKCHPHRNALLCTQSCEFCYSSQSRPRSDNSRADWARPTGREEAGPWLWDAHRLAAVRGCAALQSCGRQAPPQRTPFSLVLLGCASEPASAPVAACLQVSEDHGHTDLTTSDSLPSAEGAAEPGSLSIWWQCPVSKTDILEHFRLYVQKKVEEEGRTHHLRAGYILSTASGQAVTYHLGAP